MTSLANAFSTVSDVFTSGWSMITGNWALSAIIAIPIVFGLVAGIIAFFRR